jgi:hypothetical protein
MLSGSIGSAEDDWGAAHECSFLRPHNENRCWATSQRAATPKSSQSCGRICRGQIRGCCLLPPQLFQSLSQMFREMYGDRVVQLVWEDWLPLHRVSPIYFSYCWQEISYKRDESRKEKASKKRVLGSSIYLITFAFVCSYLSFECHHNGDKGASCLSRDIIWQIRLALLRKFYGFISFIYTPTLFK